MRLSVAETPVDARNRLVLDHVGLVKILAARVSRRVPAQVEVNELIGVGMMGLVDAARRYQPSLGVPFEAFARRRIHGAMLDTLRGLDWAPRAVRKMRRDVDAAIASLRHALGRAPDDGEIAAQLRVSTDEYGRMLDQIRAVELASVRQLESDRGDGGMLDVAIDPDDGPHAHLERAELRGHLAGAIRELPDRERQILSLYYEQELTLAEIGAVIGVGESRVSQLRTQAVARLRTRLRETLRMTEQG
ncbi:MAG TPA: RNA polymerase sigma factor FliA [Vicinamibacterales bacterium]|nr:RNA polymerase sigma factor FliA [Vicinamibacterales bacterium]